MPEGSLLDWALFQARAKPGKTAMRVNGVNKDRTRHTVKAAR